MKHIMGAIKFVLGSTNYKGEDQGGGLSLDDIHDGIHRFTDVRIGKGRLTGFLEEMTHLGDLTQNGTSYKLIA